MEYRHCRTPWAKCLANKLAEFSNGRIKQNPGDALLFQFILSTQLFITSYPKFYANFLFRSPSWDITRFNQLCLATPIPRPPPLSILPLFPALLYYLPAGIIGIFTVVPVNDTYFAKKKKVYPIYDRGTFILTSL